MNEKKRKKEKIPNVFSSSYKIFKSSFLTKKTKKEKRENKKNANTKSFISKRHKQRKNFVWTVRKYERTYKSFSQRENGRGKARWDTVNNACGLVAHRKKARLRVSPSPRIIVLVLSYPSRNFNAPKVVTNFQ